MRHRFTILLAFLCLSATSHSQAQDKPPLPQIIPPSPDAASLAEYADVPVGAYTGSPSISIPLYEVRSRDISLPISLSYHTGGVKLEEESSVVGLNWALNAGGVITRSVRGNDDFRGVTFRETDNVKGYLNSNAIPDLGDPSNTADLQYYCNGNLDGLPDQFYFNFAGHNGKFVLNKLESPGAPVTVQLQSEEKLNHYHL